MIICRDQRNGNGCGATNATGALRCQTCGMSLRYGLELHDPGTVVGNYTIIRVIGHGGFGAVYLSKHVQAEQSSDYVALKQTLDPNGIRSFYREFEVLQHLHSPHLPRYDEMFEDGDNGYLVMEFIPGQSLSDILTRHRGPLLESQVLGYALQICDGLEFLHQQKPPLLHRDIKPANIRFTPDGLIKLVDFGLIKQADQTTRSTIRGAGSMPYAPLEQYGSSGQHTDQRSDIYSLGATFYHLLTAIEPLSAGTRISTSPDPLQSVQALNPHVSSHVSHAIATAMSLFQQERFADTFSFKQALLGIVAVKPSSGPRTTTKLGDSEPLSVEAEAQNSPRRQYDAHVLPTTAPSSASLSNASLSSTSSSNQSLAVQARLFRSLGHMDAITSIVYSPDEQTLVSASRDHTVRLWRVSDGRLVRTLRGHTQQVNRVVYSPDGLTLASVSDDMSIRIWQVADGRLQGVLEGHRDSVNDARYSQDGQLLATTGIDGTIRLWQIASGDLLHVFGHPDSMVTCMAYHAPSDVLIGGDRDGLVHLWQARDGQVLATLKGHQQPVTALVSAPDGTTLVSGDAVGSICVWSLESYQLQRTLEGHSQAITSMVYHPDGQLLTSVSQDQTVRLWDVVHGQQMYWLQGHTDAVQHVAYTPDGQILATASSDTHVCLWDMTDARLLHTIEEHTGPVVQVLFAASGRLLASASTDGTTRLWRIEHE
ncbi:MAG: protein kinase [Chloroflexaceae bacterium]|nr:protein kinase [Chloroflexaceae bacterium]